MKPTHSAGPWTVAIDNNATGPVICRADGTPIAICNPVRWFRPNGTVAQLAGSEANANALLIAAAPELLAALQQFDLTERKGYDDDYLAVLRYARAAIAKATLKDEPYRQVGCGCCTGDGTGVHPENDRCTCAGHQDICRGPKTHVCAHHAAKVIGSAS